MWLFVLFLAVPLIEIALFIQVGGAIGLWSTLAVVIFTAILGTWLVRSQGIRAMMQLRGSFNELRDPTEPLAHGAMILFAGALLLTPGFFTDAFGFLLLFPPFRSAAFRYIRARVKVQSFSMGEGVNTNARPPQDDGVIDGEFSELPDDDRPDQNPNHPPSGWTRQ